MLKLNTFQKTTMNNKLFLQKLPNCYENPKTVMEIYAEDAVLNRQDSTTGQWNEFKKVWLSGYAQPKICCTFIHHYISTPGTGSFSSILYKFHIHVNTYTLPENQLSVDYRYHKYRNI